MRCCRTRLRDVFVDVPKCNTEDRPSLLLVPELARRRTIRRRHNVERAGGTAMVVVVALVVWSLSRRGGLGRRRAVVGGSVGGGASSTELSVRWSAGECRRRRQSRWSSARPTGPSVVGGNRIRGGHDTGRRRFATPSSDPSSGRTVRCAAANTPRPVAPQRLRRSRRSHERPERRALASAPVRPPATAGCKPC